METRTMGTTRRIVVIGATGTIGTELCRHLLARNDQVVVFSRDPQAAQQAVPGAAEYVAWQPEDSEPWAAHIDGATAVI